MSRHTVRTVVNDILKDLRQTTDDADITEAHIAYWVIVYANNLKAKHIDKRDSGKFLTVFPMVPVTVPQQTLATDVVQNRKYVELPANIFDFDKDEGINYIAYSSDGSPGCPPRFTITTFTRTSPTQSRQLYYLPETTPTPSNPYFYLTGMKVGLLGVEKISITSVEMGIYMPIDPVQDIDMDAPIEMPEELIVILIRQVLDLGRFVLMIPEDRRNEGDSVPSTAVPTNKIVSVNAKPEDT